MCVYALVQRWILGASDRLYNQVRSIVWLVFSGMPSEYWNTDGTMHINNL